MCAGNVTLFLTILQSLLILSFQVFEIYKNLLALQASFAFRCCIVLVFVRLFCAHLTVSLILCIPNVFAALNFEITKIMFV